MRPRHLYIHVPFCARRCSYCDFAVEAVRRPPVDEWLDAIESELRAAVAENAWTVPLDLDTIYIGGGTPSLLGTGAMAELRHRLRRFCAWAEKAVEWTAEANPENFDAELARDWRAAGVNRVSLGAQTFHEPALRWMGRLHGAEGPARAVAAARAAGFEAVNVDLIFGLPTRLGRDWREDVERILALEPDHVSLYGLTAEPATPLGRWVGAGRETMPDDERYGDEYLIAVDRLGSTGFRHYEVSNFALPGRESCHNRAYWSRAAYLGLGPGAHSFLPPRRRWNVRSWTAYRTAVSHGRPPTDAEERIDAAAERLERIWLGLRTDDGLPLDALSAGQLALAREWRQRGLAVVAAGRLRLTARGWLVLDRLVVELDALDGASSAATHSSGRSA